MPEVKKAQDSDKPRSAFHLWADSTTWHGWADFLSGISTCSKIVWLILIFLCFGLAVISIQDLLRNFIDGEKWGTTVFEKHGDGKGLPFPSVTICNVNRIQYTVAEEYNFTQPLRAYFFDFFDAEYTMDSTVPASGRMATGEEYAAWRKKHGMDHEKILDTMGFGCVQINQIRVGQEVLKSPREICKLDSPTETAIGVTITNVISAEYGRCLQFNFDAKVFNVTKTGTKQGISILFDVMDDEYLPDIMNNYLDEGLAVQVDYNQRFHIGSWIMVKSGSHGYIGIQKVSTTLRNKNFHIFEPKCTQKPKLHFLPDAQYSVPNCQVDCEQQFHIETCGCLSWLKPGNGSLPTCEFDELEKCYNSLNQSKVEQAKRELDKCKMACRPACESFGIRYTLSSLKLPSRPQRKTLKKMLDAISGNQTAHLTMEQISSTFVNLDVYFSTLQLQVIERYEIYTVNSLLSQIGGQLGLWAGISILTICHALMYLCYGLCCTWPCCSKTSVVSSK